MSVDLGQLVARSGGDPAFDRELIATFLDESAAAVERAEAGVCAATVAHVQAQAAHGKLSIARGELLATLCGEMEQHGRLGTLDD